MNITLIQPFTDSIEPPISLAVLIGPLKQAGHKVRLIDLQIPDVRRKWESVLPSEPADLVGITSMTPQIIQAHKIAQKVKTAFPTVPVILGGVHATFLPQETLRKFDAFDTLVLGEGEETIIELVSRLEHGRAIEDVKGIAYRSNGDVIITPPRPRILNLDPWPNHHEHYDFDFYARNNSGTNYRPCVSTFVSRGCPYNCRFCATKSFWTRRYVAKSTDAVLNEIRYILDRGVQSIKFRDSTFVINKRWVHELCDKILQNKLWFKWGIHARVDQVDFELFAHMKKAGLDDVYFGVESGSQKMLDFYGKEITLKQVESAFEICRKLDIDTVACIILGALPETREDMELTYAFLKKIKPTYTRVFLFMPLPGSELYSYYLDQGYKPNYNDIHAGKASVGCGAMTVEELEELRKRWIREFRVRKRSLCASGLRLAMRVRSWHDAKYAAKKILNYVRGGEENS
jgi:anaerobic magnesium-protoporphyrin IX monomethyl ester cyclase